VRKNQLTINENREIWEIVGYETGDVRFFGTAPDITDILGDDGWDHNSVITEDSRGLLRLTKYPQ